MTGQRLRVWSQQRNQAHTSQRRNRKESNETSALLPFFWNVSPLLSRIEKCKKNKLQGRGFTQEENGSVQYIQQRPSMKVSCSLEVKRHQSSRRCIDTPPPRPVWILCIHRRQTEKALSSRLSMSQCKKSTTNRMSSTVIPSAIKVLRRDTWWKAAIGGPLLTRERPLCVTEEVVLGASSHMYYRV